MVVLAGLAQLQARDRRRWSGAASRSGCSADARSALKNM